MSQQDIELREKITLIKANSLYSGASLEDVNRIPKVYLKKLESETDEIMALIHQSNIEAQINLLEQYNGMAIDVDKKIAELKQLANASQEEEKHV